METVAYAASALLSTIAVGIAVWVTRILLDAAHAYHSAGMARVRGIR